MVWLELIRFASNGLVLIGFGLVGLGLILFDMNELGLLRWASNGLVLIGFGLGWLDCIWLCVI